VKSIQTEAAISKACEQFLTLNGIINWRASVLNGQCKGFGDKHWRPIKTGIAGLSDRQALLPDGTGRTLYIEVKKPGGKQRQSQKEFESECLKLGVPYVLVESVEDLAECLDAFGVLKVRI
jgi:hypothetical protein